jgi:hypothetical protein
LDSWDIVFSNMSFRKDNNARGSLTDSSSEDSSEVDELDAGIFLSILLSELLSKDGTKGAVSFGSNLIK